MAQSFRSGQIQEFSSKAIIEDWVAHYKKGDLLSALKKHWRKYVPQVYYTYSNPAKEERVARKLLFNPMEVFLCSGDPEDMFQQLKGLDRPSQICGHVFKMGEPTYCCRDCASDPTCVLCIECFQKSAHRKHRYRMNTSGGGGYCDCGDTEAWKTEPFCETHKQGLAQEEPVNPIEALPDDLVDRASTLFMSAMQYAVELLTWEQHDSLPVGLQPEGELPNTYVTMLFNDEVHTYEQVINTLIVAVNCSQKEATDFATIVDREGRSCVRTGQFEDCEKARSVIEKNTSRHGSKPLRVHVMHTTVVAHQQFALKLIPWLQSVISRSDGLRRLFCILTMKPQQNEMGLSLMEKILLADTQLWKVARVQSHQLFMSGVLLDQECKKQFAAMFTKQYATLMKDFIQDDHYRSVSITSISVQIFTVPTLARMLIEEHDLMTVIIKAFLEHCEGKLKDGRLVFDRNERNQAFKRAWYMLYDLKYTLSCRPSAEEWTPKLRSNFLNGFNSLLELLKAMQGMDAVTRQTGQHLVFEPEWENAFNLQLKLRDNLALVLDWCSSDKEVLISAFRATMKTLQSCKEKPELLKKEKVTIVNRTAKCIKYDVANQPVSIHTPVSRLMAGLFIQLEKFGLTYHSPEIYINPAKLDAVEMLEAPLRVQVLISQTQAGMWRRNGYSLLNQIFFYHNVKCRGEMYDRDIVMLQLGAALLPSDEFMIHVLNKYNLIQWARELYEIGGQDDPVRHSETLAEEFLSLLIILLSERYVPGVGKVTPEDVVEREIIHQLCITPMAHSELVKTLPEDANHETGIEAVIHNVADFKKPTEEQKGKFDLKPECYSRYNPFFYHYSKSDQSKSEEAQLKRKKQAGLDQALPPPEPPPFSLQFTPVINLLECDVMIQVMEVVLARTQRQRSRSCPEGQFERILHLIGLALHEQRRAIVDGNTEFDFLSKATKRGKSILYYLETLVGDPNITHDAQKDLLTWVLKTLAEVRQMKNEPVAMETLESLTTFDSKQQEEKKKKAAKAAKRRAKIMAQMSAMQKNFIKDNAELFEETSTDLPHAGSDMDISETAGPRCRVALGPMQTPVQVTGVNKGMCILCQEEQEISFSGRAMVLSAFVHRSTVLSTAKSSVECDEERDPLLTPSTLPQGTHTSTCGHIMHADCWQRLFDSILAKERRRPLRIRHHLSYDIDKLEFLCPLCECLSNTVIPLVPPLATLSSDSERREVDLSFNDWLDGIQKTVHASIMAERDKESEEESLLFQPCPISTITKMMAESVARNFQLLWEYVYDDASGQFSEGMKDMLKKFTRDVYCVGLSVHPDDENVRVPVLTWNTCAYTLLTVEQCLREEQKPVFAALSSRQTDCLDSLVKVSAVVSQIISPDMIKRHCVRLLSALIPDSLGKKRKESQCLLEMDLFSYLTVLTMTLPSLHSDAQLFSINTIPMGGLNDLHALHLTLTAHLVQIILQHQPTEGDSMETESDPQAEAFAQVYCKLRSQAGLPCVEDLIPWQVFHYVKEACLPFLRSAALLFHFLTGVPPPQELMEPCSVSQEQVTICGYLSLPTSLLSLFTEQGDVITSLISRWCSSPVLKAYMAKNGKDMPRYPLPVKQLVPLPHDYSDLINQVSTFTCPKSEGDDSRAPTMCLVCGQMLCSQSYCCQTELHGSTVGAATAHTHSCGLGTGIFLRVRECQILLLFGKTKGCFFPSPYLDDYGETDQGLRRGNPLKLSPERYRKLHKLWLSHGIPEEIGHQLESNNSLMGIEWQHL
ncbi:E3 ubiquitin-protein ligase UBR2-like isoform X2 [Liolophura sinensis]|uniref:E3 ubiquitin-protein ligase UBR2-like isoform X2 n=1 Tax=Liolophura sinensis TaxID=3198878 RepID=UPI0031590C93